MKARAERAERELAKTKVALEIMGKARALHDAGLANSAESLRNTKVTLRAADSAAPDPPAT